MKKLLFILLVFAAFSCRAQQNFPPTHTYWIPQVFDTVPILNTGTYGFSYTPIDCGALTFPHYITSISANEISLYYFDRDYAKEEIEYIDITSYTHDSGIWISQGGSEITVGQRINFDVTGATIGGNVYMVRDAAGSGSLTGTVVFTIKIRGNSRITDEATYNFTYNGCP